ncbi:HypC/HybG/HupF family hydrogenase formation chaperone [Jhaorihella thermophila]|uniref:Hydrogenase expression/formation protein HypC n=1 Tax=Jhaorihella thermophila TaxID=488547 RepID=A0A1H5ULA3_9RHOB|nr:HypC/HybG/HupF family hydrogenase formation chaperone [Jhaorihella thermophila]SEF75037.1 hydrogenase expression/formation protein HypC [Jhaorihella thermophila]
MCVGIPMRIIACDGIAATATDGRREARIDLSLTGPQPPGTWVLSFLGAAREVLPEDEALKIRAALDGLAAVIAGGEPGDAFADLEETGPTLPPHLAAAKAAGKTIA